MPEYFIYKFSDLQFEHKFHHARFCGECDDCGVTMVQFGDVSFNFFTGVQWVGYFGYCGVVGELQGKG